MAFLISGYIDWIIPVGILLFSLYYYFTLTYDYWKKRGVRYMKPVPLIGNSMFVVRGVKHSSLDQVEAYNEFREERYFGRFNFRRPVLVLRDPELVESVLIKDFTHFYNRGFKIDPKLDRLSLHLINLRDQHWKNLRMKLTPVFSSGKLKSMHQTLVDCCESLNDVLESYATSKTALNARIVMGNFTTEVIGHCAFGLNMNNLKNPNSEFRMMAKLFFKPSRLGRIRMMIRLTFPKILSWIGWKAMPRRMEDFFIGMIKETMRAREKSNIEVKDFLQLLINLRKEDQNMLTELQKDNRKKSIFNAMLMDDSLITSNAMVFFLAGYETTASTLSFALFELAQNSDIQTTLREEVRSAVAKYNGVPTFEALKNMPYLEQVILETLRKYPPAGSLPRECSKDWKLPGTDILITEGTMVQVPVYSLHHDPEYYPDPETFLPERFSEENKQNLRKGTFLPFGDGPRMCIGKRFAELEIKVALSSMILKYKFKVNSKCQYPFKFHPRSIFLNPLGGIWIDIEKITNEN